MRPVASSAVAAFTLIASLASSFAEGMQPPAAPGFETHAALVAAFATGKIDTVDARPATPKEVLEEKGLTYKTAGGIELKLDLFRPAKTDKPTPLLVFIHGGGWSGGERWHYTGYCGHFASEGYAAATIDYRLSGDAPYPAALDDCRDAVSWLRENAEKYLIDSEKVAVAGGSAGGHLAMMVGYSGKSEIKAVVNIYGVYDLTTPLMRSSPLVQAFLGGANYDKEAKPFEEASPKSHLDQDDPPTLVIHGTLDKVVPVGQSDGLVRDLRRLGIEHSYDRLEGWNHAMDVAALVNRRCTWQMGRFFDQHLGSE